MAGEIEAAGDAVTGGLLARAVERRTSASTHLEYGVCRNCGTALAGDYCHACGQEAHLHRSLSAIWHDLAHGVLHFEGKICRTLPMLAFRPGELTRRYIAGERTRFVSPLALFLFSVFLLFAVFSALGGLTLPEDAQTRAGAAAIEEIDRARDALGALERRRAEAARAGAATAALDREIAERLDGLAQLERVVIMRRGDSRISINPDTGWKALDKGVAKAAANPNLLVYKLQANAYKFSWALIPLSLPFVWLMFFWRRDLHVYDHAVFVTYSLSFMSLLAIALTLASQLNLHDDIVALLALLVPPLHLYRHLRGAYSLGWRSTLVRLLVLLVFAVIVVLLFVGLLLGLGLLG